MSDIDCCSGCGIDGFKTGETANGWIVILWLTGFSTEVRSRGAIGFHTFLFGAHWPILIHFWLFCFRMIAQRISNSFIPRRLFWLCCNSEICLPVVCLWRDFIFGHFTYLRKHSSTSFQIHHLHQTHFSVSFGLRFVLVRREVLLICTKKKNIL